MLDTVDSIKRHKDLTLSSNDIDANANTTQLDESVPRVAPRTCRDAVWECIA